MPAGGQADVIVFWKQNDSTLYGRRVDMVVRYLASRVDIRRVVVVDAPIGDRNLARLAEDRGTLHHGCVIHLCTLEKLRGARDEDKVSYRVYVCPLAKYRFREDGTDKPPFIEGYDQYLQEVFTQLRIVPARSVFWFYPRNAHAPALINRFTPAKVVVDVVDDDRAWPGISDATRKKLTDGLRQLLPMADMVFANCVPVQRSMSEFVAGIRLVPNGCDAEPPMASEPAAGAVQRLLGLRGRRVIGFVGNLESKIDIPLLHKVAERFPDATVVLAGSTHANPSVRELDAHANVCMPGVVPYEDLGAWLQRFDVGLIPHLDTALTRCMNPLKAYVYLAWQVPVVATAVANIDASNGLIHVAATHDAFLDAIARILAGDRPAPSAFHDYVSRNSWKVRFAQHVDELLVEHVDARWGSTP